MPENKLQEKLRQIGLSENHLNFHVYYERERIPREGLVLSVLLDRQAMTKDNVLIQYKMGHTIFAHSSLTGFSGNHLIIISHNMYVYYDWRNKGIGTLLNIFRSEVLKQIGFKCIICTVRNDNTPQMRIMHNNGWRGLDYYTYAINTTVNMFIKHL